ncbi:MAG: hypothetical protein A2V77_20550 [Anaeromyxobacter sp. RBG_16_69_14]|nr:MAG: hypothetical protein A2V77_20550 [Anaeromyxobacter sp. RBG_16_69_14]
MTLPVALAAGPGGEGDTGRGWSSTRAERAPRRTARAQTRCAARTSHGRVGGGASADLLELTAARAYDLEPVTLRAIHRRDAIARRGP